jgi:hypothetical protein
MLLSTKTKINLKYLTALLNSKLINFYYKEYFNTIDVLKNALLSIPIKADEKIFKVLIKLTDLISGLIIQTKTINNSFSELVYSKFRIPTEFQKNTNWLLVSFGEFIKELEKARKKSSKVNDNKYTKLSLNEEAEWMQYFNEQKEKVQSLEAEIDSTDREIDNMVYELYGLTYNEIKIVEDATV